MIEYCPMGSFEDPSGYAGLDICDGGVDVAALLRAIEAMPWQDKGSPTAKDRMVDDGLDVSTCSLSPASPLSPTAISPPFSSLFATPPTPLSPISPPALPAITHDESILDVTFELPPPMVSAADQPAAAFVDPSGYGGLDLDLSPFGIAQPAMVGDASEGGWPTGVYEGGQAARPSLGGAVTPGPVTPAAKGTPKFGLTPMVPSLTPPPQAASRLGAQGFLKSRLPSLAPMAGCFSPAPPFASPAPPHVVNMRNPLASPFPTPAFMRQPYTGEGGWGEGAQEVTEESTEA